MAQYIDKATLVAEIERRIKNTNNDVNIGAIESLVVSKTLYRLISFIDTLEVKEVGISIPNIYDTLKEEGLDPDSKEAKVFKESYYMALEKLKAKKGEEV